MKNLMIVVLTVLVSMPAFSNEIVDASDPYSSMYGYDKPLCMGYRVAGSSSFEEGTLNDMICYAETNSIKIMGSEVDGFVVYAFRDVATQRPVVVTFLNGESLGVQYF